MAHYQTRQTVFPIIIVKGYWQWHPAAQVPIRRKSNAIDEASSVANQVHFVTNPIHFATNQVHFAINPIHFAVNQVHFAPKKIGFARFSIGFPVFLLIIGADDAPRIMGKTRLVVTTTSGKIGLLVVCTIIPCPAAA